MTGVFTDNGDWRQAAENADGPLGSAMFINHGIRISEGVPRADGGGPPRAPRMQIGQGGIGRFSAPPGPGCSDAGWDSDSPAGAAMPLKPRDIPRTFPPESPREAILKVDNTSVLVVIKPLSEGWEFGPGRVSGRDYSGEKSPAIKVPDRFTRSGT